MKLREAVENYINLLPSESDKRTDKDVAAEMLTLAQNDEMFFYVLSQRYIDIGMLEQLSPEGYLQSIQNIAYQIAHYSALLEIAQAPRFEGEETKLYYDVPGLGTNILELEKIFAMTCFAAGVHFDKGQKDLDKWLAHYTLLEVEKMLVK